MNLLPRGRCALGAVLSFVMCGAAQAQSVSAYRTYPLWSAAAQARQMAIPALPYAACPEGEIKTGAAISPTFLETVGVERVIGVSPGGSYFGTPGVMTRLFMDKPNTANSYGSVYFPPRDFGTNPPAACIRPVACDANGNPLNTHERGALETGTMVYDLKANMYGFALNLVDVEAANSTRIEIRFAADRGTAGQVTYVVPTGADNQTQFFGFLFEQPITRVVVYLGNFNAADGVVISQNWAARLAVPPPPCGDLNGDAMVDSSDLSIMLARFGQVVGANGRPYGDTNADEKVDMADLSVLLGSFGTECGPMGETIGDDPVIDPPPPDDEEPKQPTDPKDPEDPKEPTDPKEPKEPKDPGDPEDPGDPKDPGEPGDGGGEDHGPQDPGPADDEEPGEVPDGDEPIEPVIPTVVPR